MNIKRSTSFRKVVYLIILFGTIVGASGIGNLLSVQAQEGGNSYFRVNTFIIDGISIDENIINGPSSPPPGYELERTAVDLTEPIQTMAIHALTVPAFNWVFGCSSVSGAMIAGYYDRNGFPNMYSGPTNGGVMPLDNSSWPTWSDGTVTYPNLPLAASHNGVDGRVTRGSIDDYWVLYGSSAQDPYITGSWTQHTWADAIGDYMKTSQSAFSNTDGSTTFWTYTTSPSQLTCSYMVSQGITNDGTVGRKLFYEARGYTVTDCYNQKTDNTVTGGFSLAQFKAEIDAGRPVMLNLEGHTIVGVGYDDASSTIYIHDTWDYLDHTMTWGGSYSGMGLLSVSIVNLQVPSHTVTFNANGGTGTMSNQVASVPTALTLNSFTRVGYSFSGWNTNAGGTGTAYANGAIYPFSADATLYAQWTANTYTVTFDANGGSTPVPTSKVVTYASAYGTLATTSRTGYTFNGWFTAASGGTQVTAATVVNTAANHTLYAQWTVLPNHTVTFDANGGTGTMSNQTANVATALTLNAFTLSGYNFTGWNTAANGSGTAYANGATYSFAADITLYAQWTTLPNHTVFLPMIIR